LGQINLNCDCHVGLNFVSFLPILKSWKRSALPSRLQRHHLLLRRSARQPPASCRGALLLFHASCRSARTTARQRRRSAAAPARHLYKGRDDMDGACCVTAPNVSSASSGGGQGTGEWITPSFRF